MTRPVAPNDGLAMSHHLVARRAYMPFSYGKRDCIGCNLAMLIIPTVLALLLRRHVFTLHEDSMHPEGIPVKASVTLSPPRLGLHVFPAPEL